MGRERLLPIVRRGPLAGAASVGRMSKQQFNVRLEPALIDRINSAAEAHGSKERALAAAFDALERHSANAPAQARQPVAQAPQEDLASALERAAIELRRLQRLVRFAKTT